MQCVDEDGILEGSSIHVPFGNLDDGLLFMIKLNGNLEKITFSRMTPNSWIRLLINAVTRATFTSDSKGFAECVFEPALSLDDVTAQLEFEKMQSKAFYALTMSNMHS